MEITLVKGSSYTYKGVRYTKGVTTPVEDTLGVYLVNTGKFTSVKGAATAAPAPAVKKPAATTKVAEDKAAGKLKIKRREDPAPEVKETKTEETKTETAGEPVPQPKPLPDFKSKAEVLAYAEKEYGIELESTKFEAMKTELADHIKDLAEQKAAELTRSKEGAVAV